MSLVECDPLTGLFDALACSASSSVKAPGVSFQSNICLSGAGDTPERVLSRLQAFAASENRTGEVTIRNLEFVQLSPVSSTHSLGFQLIQRAANEVLRGAEVSIL